MDSCSACRCAILCVATALLFPVTGCKHRETVRKGQAQRRELKSLYTQRDQLTAELAAAGPDLSATLADARSRAERQEKERPALEARLAEVEKSNLELGKAFDAYRAAHPAPRTP